MKLVIGSKAFALVALFSLMAVGSFARIDAQAAPTATASIRLSAFGGISSNFTGLELAKNVSLTGGVDVGFRPFHGIFPSLEGRGMYPIAKGSTVSMENVLVGVRLARQKDRFNPYGDVLFGRGKLDFAGLGYPNPAGTFYVVSNTTSVLSFGGGLDYLLSEHFGVKGDFQFQKYDTPVAVNGALYSKVFTAGVVYRLGTGGVRGLRGRR